MEYFRLILVEKGSINKTKYLKLFKPLIFRTKIHFENVQSLRVSVFQPLPYVWEFISVFFFQNSYKTFKWFEINYIEVHSEHFWFNFCKPMSHYICGL